MPGPPEMVPRTLPFLTIWPLSLTWAPGGRRGLFASPFWMPSLDATCCAPGTVEPQATVTRHSKAIDAVIVPPLTIATSEISRCAGVLGHQSADTTGAPRPCRD